MEYRGDEPSEMGANLRFIHFGDQRVKSLSVGYYHACVLLRSGSIRCWGAGGYGQLGQGSSSNLADGPNEMGDQLPNVELGTTSPVTKVFAGQLNTCALTADGRLRCWGDASWCVLANGAGTYVGDEPGEMGEALVPMDFGTTQAVVDVAFGNSHACALFVDGSLKCWGNNYYGQLGGSDVENRGDQPGEMGSALPFVDLGTGRRAVAVSAGGSQTCAVLDDQTLKCWGEATAGQLGYGDGEHRGDGLSEMGDALPTVPLGTGFLVADVACGYVHTCALSTEGRVKCWGANSYGGVGLPGVGDIGNDAGDMGDALPFVELGTTSPVIKLAAGDHITCAFFEDRTTRCWGWNTYGQLGQGDTMERGYAEGTMGSALLPISLE
jgi:alpha-tubulin suppressor-like RCC1 family protein